MSAAVLLLMLAQVPYRLADVNPMPLAPQNSNPLEFTDTGGGIAFFFAETGAAGTELWRTDGTDAGTWLTRDLTPGYSDSETLPLGVLDAGLVVMLEDDRLFISDGTTPGTRRVCCHTLQVARFAMLPPGRVVFGGFIGTTATLRLYLHDGSPEGATEIANVAPSEFVGLVGSRLLFFGRVDNLGPFSLWATDGTTAGTVALVLANSGNYSAPTMFGGQLYLWAQVAGTPQLVRTDGTVAGTQVLGPFNGGNVSSSLVAGATRLYCSASAGVGVELYGSPGAGGDFALVTDLRSGPGSSTPSGLKAFNGGVLFKASATTAEGTEPFFVDDATQTVRSLGDLNPGTTGCFPDFYPNGSRALLTCTTGAQVLWVTDGTDAGTVALAPPTSQPTASEVARFGSGWLFRRRSAIGEANDPWFTDGTSTGTRRVAQISQRGTQSSIPVDFIAPLGLRVPFMADDGVTGWEPQLIDVLDGGIKRQGDLWPGLGDGAFVMLGTANGRAFLAGASPTYGMELYATSGQPGDLDVPVRDIFPGTGDSRPGRNASGRYRASVVGERIYFPATTPNEGIELWVSDGTAAGTRLVADLDPLGDGDPRLMTGLPDGGFLFAAWPGQASSPRLYRLEGDGGLTLLGPSFSTEAAVFRGGLLIDHYTPQTGWELWVTDGTPAGTKPYAEVVPGSEGGDPLFLTALGDRVFFIAFDTNDVVGLYSTADTDSGVQLIGNLGPLNQWSSTALYAGATGVYFSHTTLDAGREVWFSNGDGMALLKDVMPGEDSSGAAGFVRAGNKMFFAAADPLHGRELWVSDGTSEGTRMVADVLPGPASSDPEYLFPALGWLFFSAQDEYGDLEPYALPLASEPPSIVPELTGQTGGDGGWFVSDVGVTFTVTDPVVPILTSVECGTSRIDIDGGFIGSTVVTQDGPDTQLSCTATSSGGTRTVTVSVRRDATAPRVMCPALVVANASSVMGATVTFETPVAVDQIDPAPQVTVSRPSGTSFSLGRTVVTATATDLAGHTSECSFIVEVRDGVDPVVTCPAMESTAQPGTPFDFTATASDNIDPSPVLTYSAPPGTIFPAGRSAVTVTAVDAAGNLGACLFFVNVDAAADGGGGGGGVNGACGCSASGGLMLFALLALVRRRRR
ncbi:MAG: HYR domain-containing protein [Myxococcaceae bacterium]|nr:HYR domain-containing protein [Myxococcaceae bacterium]